MHGSASGNPEWVEGMGTGGYTSQLHSQGFNIPGHVDKQSVGGPGSQGQQPVAGYPGYQYNPTNDPRIAGYSG